MPATTARLPIALCQGLILGGLSAPALRIALVLAAHADASGRFSMTKPSLERLTDIRMDNADRILDRVRGAEAEIDGDPVRAFDDITYTPGVQKRLAGIVTGSLSSGMVTAMAHPRFGGRFVTVDLGELGKLSTVPGILLWLRLATERRDGEVRLRLRDEDMLGLFGSYIGRAAITRTTVKDGEHVWTGLSRIFTNLVDPGVRDLWNALEDVLVDARPISRTGRGHGRAWSSIELEMAPVRKLPSIREMAAAEREKAAYHARKHDPIGSS